MQATRRARLQSLIQEELSTAILTEVKDPRIGSITITQVELTQDAGQANIFITLLGGGDSRKLKESLAGLNSASGFLRRRLARDLTLRSVPTLVFKEDKGLENTLRVHEILRGLAEAKSTPPAENDGQSQAR